MAPGCSIIDNSDNAVPEEGVWGHAAQPHNSSPLMKYFIYKRQNNFFPCQSFCGSDDVALNKHMKEDKSKIEGAGDSWDAFCVSRMQINVCILSHFHLYLLMVI